MRIFSIHHYDAPSDSQFRYAVDLDGEGVSIRIYAKTEEELKKLVSDFLVLVNAKKD